jgi:hypothetical protein
MAPTLEALSRYLDARDGRFPTRTFARGEAPPPAARQCRAIRRGAPTLAIPGDTVPQPYSIEPPVEEI